MNHSMRRAALALHALNDKDQSWLLGRLPAQQSGVLKGLLDELQTLGIPADVLPGVEGANDANLSVSAAASAPNDESMDMRRASAWAAQESDWVVAQVLLGMRISRREELLATLEIDRKQRLEKLCAEINPVKGLLRGRLLSNAYATIRRTGPAESQRFHAPQKGVSKWLRSFVRRA